MTLMAQTECCTMLGIDPKTLRNWLKRAHMQFTAHPTDARLKCLTDTQVQQLATLHGRPLPSTPPVPVSAASETDLHQTLLHLQRQVGKLLLQARPPDVGGAADARVPHDPISTYPANPRSAGCATTSTVPFPACSCTHWFSHPSSNGSQGSDSPKKCNCSDWWRSEEPLADWPGSG